MVAELAAGGRVTFSAPGQSITVRLLEGTWVRILIPADAAIRAATDGIDPVAHVKLEQAVGTVWRADRGWRPRRALPAAPAAVAAPAGEPRLGSTPPPRPTHRGDTAQVPASRLAQVLANIHTDAMPVESDSLEAVAAREVFAQFRPHIQACSLNAAASWIRLHVRTGLQQLRPGAARASSSAASRTCWQWGLALMAWLFEHAGLSQRKVWNCR